MDTTVEYVREHILLYVVHTSNLATVGDLQISWLEICIVYYWVA